MNQKNPTILSLLTIFLGLSPSLLFAQTVIDTSLGWNDNPWLGAIGENGTTDGQTFTAPAEAPQLDAFSFWVGVDDFGPLKYAAYVAAWDGTHLTGPILYESPLQTLPAPGGPRVAHKVTFNTDGVQLTPGAEYIAFISTSAFQDGVFDQGAIGFRDADFYPGGQTFFQENGSDFSQLFQNPWSSISGSPGSDLAFQAVFAVPEPSILWLLGGAGLLVWTCRRLCMASTKASVAPNKTLR